MRPGWWHHRPSPARPRPGLRPTPVHARPEPRPSSEPSSVGASSVRVLGRSVFGLRRPRPRSSSRHRCRRLCRRTAWPAPGPPAASPCGHPARLRCPRGRPGRGKRWRSARRGPTRLASWLSTACLRWCNSSVSRRSCCLRQANSCWVRSLIAVACCLAVAIRASASWTAASLVCSASATASARIRAASLMSASRRCRGLVVVLGGLGQQRGGLAPGPRRAACFIASMACSRSAAICWRISAASRSTVRRRFSVSR